MSTTMMKHADPAANLDAERAVLGAILLDGPDNAALLATMRILSGPEDFHQQAHQAIYRAALDLYDQGAPTTAPAVLDVLARVGDLNRVGGGPYLHTLVADAVPTALVDHHARLISSAALRRRMVEIGTRITQYGQSVHDEQDLLTALDRARETLDGALAATHRDGAKPTLAAVTRARIEAFQRGDADTGVPSGLLDLDNILGGARPGQLITIAARPGVGKSTLAVDWARHAAIRAGRPVFFVSLEMSCDEIGERLVSAETRVPLAALKTRGGLNPHQARTVAGFLDGMDDLPLIVDDTPVAGVPDIRARARRHDDDLRRQSRARGEEERGLGMIVVDYLQLMTSGKRVESRQLEVSEFSRQLKLLAKELGVPVIALSQLNRGPEQRQDKTPQLSDLRESGAIEQDSDVVILIHDPTNGEQDHPRAGEVDLIIAKHRGGPRGTVTVTSQLHMARFGNVAHVVPPSD